MHSKGQHNSDLSSGMSQGAETLAKGTPWNAKSVPEEHFVMLKRLCILVFSFVNFFAGGYIFLEFVVCIFVFCFPCFVVFSYFSSQVSGRRCAVHCLGHFVSLHGLRITELGNYPVLTSICFSVLQQPGRWSLTDEVLGAALIGPGPALATASSHGTQRSPAQEERRASIKYGCLLSHRLGVGG